MAANTFIELNDTPGDYTGASGLFLRVNSTTGNTIVYDTVSLDNLRDVDAEGAYDPLDNQILVYNAYGGAQVDRWRPANITQIFSITPGNGLNSTIPNNRSVNLNVEVLPGGGLGVNAQGIYIADVANVAGSYGGNSSIPTFTVNSKGQITEVSEVTVVDLLNFSYVQNVQGTPGQIVVTDDGNSNLTVDLVATGVTAATYGNATHIPVITVDTYGRIQTVEEIDAFGNISLGDANANISLGDITTQAFSTVRIDDDGVISTFAADGPSDTLNIRAGLGINITGNILTDEVEISSDINALQFIGVGVFGDVNTTGVQNGETLIYDSANAEFVPGLPAITADVSTANIGELADVNISNLQSGDLLQWSVGDNAFRNVALNILDSNANAVYTGIEVVYAAPAGNGYLTYNDAGLFTFTPADVPRDVSDLTDTGNVIPSTLTDLGISDGTAGQVLRTDGNGSFTFGSITGSTPSTVERFKLNYAANGDLVSISDQSSGVANVVIESATGGGVRVTFDNSLYNFPPTSIMFYGYDYTNNKYWVVPLDTSVALRELSAGGSSGSPTLFNGTGTVELRLQMREADTGASRGSFGTTTHAWAQFIL